MELEKLDLSNPETWTYTRIMDQFISDVLIPDRESRLFVGDLYEVLEQYCKEMELATPSKRAFGMRLSKRFQRLSNRGKPMYCCSVKPELVLTD